MQIYGPTQIHSAQAVNAPHRAYAPQGAAPAGRPAAVDQLDISPEASFVSQARDLPDIRADRVASIRSAIAAGTYETDAKLNTAISRLFDEIG